MLQFYDILSNAKEEHYMSLLENFKPFNFNEGVPYVSITNHGITFNKSVVMKLDYPKFALLLIDANSKQIAVKSSSELVPNAVPFYKEKKSNVISVRWNGRDLLNTIQEMMGWDLEKNSFRIDGSLLKEENAMIFDLKTAKPLN